MFIYDPLLVVFVVGCVLLWPRLTAPVKALAISLAVFLVLLVAGYARYYLWSGEAAWGDRFVTPPAHLAALLAMPMLLRFGSAAPRIVRSSAIAVLAVSILLQASSLVFPSYFERLQAGIRDVDSGSPQLTLQGTYFQAGMRVRNIVGVATGNFESWGLNVTPTGEHIGLHPPQLLPLLPMRTLPSVVALSIKSVWFIGAILLGWLVARCLRDVVLVSETL